MTAAALNGIPERRPGQALTVAIATYNGRGLLEVVLPSLARQRYRDFDVLVVDDASTDDTVTWLRGHWPTVRVVEHPRNRGVTAAFNTCLAATDTELVGLFNNDIELHPDCLQELVDAMRAHPDAAAAAAKLLDYRDRTVLDGTGDIYTWGGEANRRGQGERDIGQFDEPEAIFSVCGGAAVYRRSAIDRVGTFDERFYAICEDVDWSFRAQLAGYSCRYVPTAVAYHMGSATLGRGATDFALYHNWRNAIWLVAKNYPLAALVRHAPELAFVQARNLGIALRRRRGGLWLRVWRDALRGLPGMLRDRSAIQRSRVRSHRELDALIGAGR